VRLAVIIPYRDREQHLVKMLPHTVSFFRRNTNIEPLFCIAEQVDDCPFNRGAIVNQAYAAISGMVDYVCFHDVDYMPMWADYSEPSLPSRIVWHGMDTRPVGHGTDGVVKAQRYGLAAVAVMKKWHFEACNGYSNTYWGWGYEDTDLAKRLESVGLPVGYRDGTFIALDHDSNGYNANGETEASKANAKRFADRVYPNMVDGLATLNADVVEIQHMEARGLAESETAPLVWCKYDLKEMYEDEQKASQNR
jgi:hypothetical protein